MSAQPKKPVDSKRTAREKAAAARAAQEAADKRRDRTIRIVGAIAVAAVVVGVILVGVIGKSGSNSPAATASTNPNAVVPTGVSKSDWGVTSGTASSTAPRLDLWEDFQCPICAELQKINGATIDQLAQAGKVQLVWHPATFIDQKFPNSPNKNSSLRSTNAWGCAIDAGKTQQYHDALFATQNKTEGNGWTDQQLLDLGKSVGITGDVYTTFQQCVSSGKYNQWAANSENEFDALVAKGTVTGTPTGILNGTVMDNNTLFSTTALPAAIAAAGPAPSPSHS